MSNFYFYNNGSEDVGLTDTCELIQGGAVSTTYYLEPKSDDYP